MSDFFGIVPPGLYRDPERGKVAGVCAGLGAYFQVRPKAIRVAFILGSVFGLFIPLGILYALLTILLPPLPDDVARRRGGWRDDGFQDEAGRTEQDRDPTRRWWAGDGLAAAVRGRGGNGQDVASRIDGLADRFRTLDGRLASMEARVTSDEFLLRQKFREL
ncbi:MAG: PspC domain-containing protein [Telmatospirillum sp.]|nr:PspC domain-containing protein [Telmatospirillum sp.]